MNDSVIEKRRFEAAGLTEDEQALFGGWSISLGLLECMLIRLPRGKTLLELGSGPTSPILARFWNVISIEHHPDFMQRWEAYTAEGGKGWIAIHAPIVNGWYAPDAITIGLKDTGPYDAILIDGPPSGAAFEARGNIKNHLGLFNWNVPVFIDDLQRPDDRRLFDYLADILAHPQRKVRETWGDETKVWGLI